ncbi:hypothetical protein ES703_92916 [subsurface metagenome]
MPVEIKEFRASRSYNKDTDATDYSKTWIVSGERIPADAAAALGIPDIGDAYPGVAACRCINLAAERYGHNAVRIDADYSTSYGRKDWDDKYAFGGELGEVVSSYSLGTRSRIVYTDLDGQPIGGPRVLGTTRLEPTCEANFKTWLSSFSVGWYWDLLGTVNNGSYKGADAGALLFIGVAAHQIELSKFEVSFVLSYHPDGWQFPWRWYYSGTKDVVGPGGKIIKMAWRHFFGPTYWNRIYDEVNFGALPI